MARFGIMQNWVAHFSQMSIYMKAFARVLSDLLFLASCCVTVFLCLETASKDRSKPSFFLPLASVCLWKPQKQMLDKY
jgi:hypothetical protein